MRVVRSFTRTGRTTLGPMNGFFFMPQSVFSVEWPLVLARVADGRLYVGATSSTSSVTTGRSDIHEILPDGTSTRMTLPGAPAFHAVSDFFATGPNPTDLVFASSEWTDHLPTRAFTLTCTPP